MGRTGLTGRGVAGAANGNSVVGVIGDTCFHLNLMYRRQRRPIDTVVTCGAQQTRYQGKSRAVDSVAVAFECKAAT
jgi:hypothetical protein